MAVKKEGEWTDMEVMNDICKEIMYGSGITEILCEFVLKWKDDEWEGVRDKAGIRTSRSFI